MSADLARSIVDALDEDALDHLARLLAPRLGRTAPSGPLDVEMAATRAHVSEKTVRRALTSGLLDGRKVAGRWQTTAEVVDVWHEQGCPTAAAGLPVGNARARHHRGQNGTAAILGTRRTGA